MSVELNNSAWVKRTCSFKDHLTKFTQRRMSPNRPIYVI